MDNASTSLDEKGRVYGLSTGRLEALSDGVLAIVITLLVLSFDADEKQIEQLTRASHGQVLAYLMSLWPHALGYVLSFFLIGIYWILHHVMFHHIRRASRGLLWLNMLFLMSVAFLPFPTDLLAECIFHESNVVVALYGLAHLITGLSLAGVWFYAVHDRRLVDEEIDPALIRTMTISSLLGPVMYAIGAVVSVLSIQASIVIYALVPVLYVMPGRLDHLWLHLGASERRPFSFRHPAMQS